MLNACIITSKNKNKYAKVKVAGKTILKHRYVWEQAFGKIPDGFLVLHMCDNRPCHNIHHLYLGTQKDNIADCHFKKRSRQAKTTHCPKGHAYDEVNTRYSFSSKDNTICRKCRECHRQSEKRRRLNAARN